VLQIESYISHERYISHEHYIRKQFTNGRTVHLARAIFVKSGRVICEAQSDAAVRWSAYCGAINTKGVPPEKFSPHQ
jgi:hypothetical protein